MEIGHVNDVEGGQLVTVGDHRHHVLLEQRADQHVGVSQGKIDNGQRQESAHQLRGQRGGRGVYHDEAYVRMGLGHGGVQRWHQPTGHGTDDAQTNVSHYVMAKCRDIRHQPFEFGLDTSGPGHHDLAFFGEATSGAIHQRCPQLFLQAGNMGTDVGLDGVELVGGSRERSTFGHGDEGSKLTKIHR